MNLLINGRRPTFHTPLIVFTRMICSTDYDGAKTTECKNDYKPDSVSGVVLNHKTQM